MKPKTKVYVPYYGELATVESWPEPIRDTDGVLYYPVSAEPDNNLRLESLLDKKGYLAEDVLAEMVFGGKRKIESFC